MDRWVPFVLAGGSLVIAVAFGVLSYLCGGMQVEANSPGEPANEPQCVSRFYPLVPYWAGFAVLGLVGLAFRRAWPAMALGVVGTALGLLTGLSSGWFGIGSGGLLLAAGLLERRRQTTARRAA